MTQGLAAGPYGDPSRWDLALNDNMTRQEALSGGYERWVSSLSILNLLLLCVNILCVYSMYVYIIRIDLYYI